MNFLFQKKIKIKAEIVLSPGGAYFLKEFFYLKTSKKRQLNKMLFFLKGGNKVTFYLIDAFLKSWDRLPDYFFREIVMCKLISASFNDIRKVEHFKQFLLQKRWASDQ